MSEMVYQSKNSPLGNIDCRFENYLKAKKAAQSKHIIGTDVMDYAYSTDLSLRKKLDSIPGLYTIAKRIASTEATKAMHKAQQFHLAVGPDQFPEIHEIGCECAQTLGIGVPNIYISSNDTFNAFAYGSEEIEPFIMLGNLLVKRFSLDELKTIIGHECGHIQNGHIAYYTLAHTTLLTGATLASILLNQFSRMISLAAEQTINMWSRSAEVTADRAGMICCNSLESVYSAEAKFLYGAVDISDKTAQQVNVDAVLEQMRDSMNNPSRVVELDSSHPLTGKRIAADMEFSSCETFLSWRPDLKQPGQMIHSKALTDERCEKILNII